MVFTRGMKKKQDFKKNESKLQKLEDEIYSDDESVQLNLDEDESDWDSEALEIETGSEFSGEQEKFVGDVVEAVVDDFMDDENTETILDAAANVFDEILNRNPVDCVENVANVNTQDLIIEKKDVDTLEEKINEYPHDFENFLIEQNLNEFEKIEVGFQNTMLVSDIRSLKKIRQHLLEKMNIFGIFFLKFYDYGQFGENFCKFWYRWNSDDIVKIFQSFYKYDNLDKLFRMELEDVERMKGMGIWRNVDGNIDYLNFLKKKIITSDYLGINNCLKIDDLWTPKYPNVCSDYFENVYFYDCDCICIGEHKHEIGELIKYLKENDYKYVIRINNLEMHGIHLFVNKILNLTTFENSNLNIRLEKQIPLIDGKFTKFSNYYSFEFEDAYYGMLYESLKGTTVEYFKKYEATTSTLEYGRISKYNFFQKLQRAIYLDDFYKSLGISRKIIPCL